MDTTFDVKIWKTWHYKGKRTSTYWVRWAVAGNRRKEPFKSSALAESFRSELIVAARRGEAFDIVSGWPISMQRAEADMSWYLFACKFADMKWNRSAGTTRRTHAEALTRVTTSMLSTDRGKPDDKLLRHALNRWAFNKNRRNSADCPTRVKDALRWLEKNTRPVSSLAKPDVLRMVLDGLAVCLDGRPAASSRVSRHRKVFNTAVGYTIELKMLTVNPIPALKWTAPKSSQAVDRRRVANPAQARTLLNSVREQGRCGPRMVAFYACLYYAALRPEEAAGLLERHLAIPAQGWGELHLEIAEPHAGKDWTNNGKNRDQRQLKQREVGEVRTVPCPPELTALLHEHMKLFPPVNGRIFTGERNKEELPKGTVNRVWRDARKVAFTPDVVASPLAETPYDLRHAAVSTWLNAGVPPSDVAEWAGHSVEILMRIYYKCLDGGSELLKKKIQAALGHD